MPRPVLSLDATPSAPPKQPMFRFTLTGRGKGHDKIVFDISAPDGKAAMRKVREIIAYHVVTTEDLP